MASLRCASASFPGSTVTAKRALDCRAGERVRGDIRRTRQSTHWTEHQHTQSCISTPPHLQTHTPVCTRVRSTLASRQARAAAWTATPTSCGHRPQTDAHSPGRRGCRLRDRRRGKQGLTNKMREGKQESSPLPPPPDLPGNSAWAEGIQKAMWPRVWPGVSNTRT